MFMVNVVGLNLGTNSSIFSIGTESFFAGEDITLGVFDMLFLGS
mgnify:CR=1 FL=1